MNRDNYDKITNNKHNYIIENKNYLVWQMTE